MAAFNMFAVNKDNVKYYSVTSDLAVDKCSQFLKMPHEYIAMQRSNVYKSDNDGVFCPDETKWGNHIAHLYMDHAELVGLKMRADVGFGLERVVRNLEQEEGKH